MRVKRVLAGVVGAATAAAIAAAPTGAGSASASTDSGVRPSVTNDMAFLRTASVSSLAAAARKMKPTTGTDRRIFAPDVDQRRVGGAGPAIRVGNPPGTPVKDAEPGSVEKFDGLSHADSRNAYGGNQYSGEPPDGAICQSGDVVVEVVNSAIQFFNRRGIMYTPPLALNQFFGLPPAIDRSNGTFPGPFVFDPRCVYDPGTGRMFILAVGLEQDPTTGALTGKNRDFLAVSTSSNAVGSYFQYAIKVSAVNAPGCPCLADFPMIGTDRNVFAISYNEFPFSGGYNGAKLAVLDKNKLAAGRTGPVARFKLPRLGGQPSYTLQPASIPPGGQYADGARGTLWFLSAIPSDNGDNRAGLAALTNTSAISTNPSAIRYKDTIVNGVLPFANPPKAQQKPGPRPLGKHLEDLFGVPNEPLRKLDTGFQKTSTVELAAGKLWTVINTRVGNGSGARAGLIYLAVDPRMTSSGGIAGSVAHQGYVAVDNAYLMYGDIAVTADGSSVALVATLSGKNYWPSAVYGRLDPTKGSRAVDALHIYGTGAGPDDGFTCYKAFVGSGVSRGCRWGDYSEINVGTDGKFYMETEYITSGLRTLFANWGTRVGRMPS